MYKISSFFLIIFMGNKISFMFRLVRIYSYNNNNNKV